MAAPIFVGARLRFIETDFVAEFAVYGDRRADDDRRISARRHVGLHWRVGRISLSHVSAASWDGLIYLTLIGGLVGYTAYVWLLKKKCAAAVGVDVCICESAGGGVARMDFCGRNIYGADGGRGAFDFDVGGDYRSEW